MLHKASFPPTRSSEVYQLSLARFPSGSPELPECSPENLFNVLDSAVMNVDSLLTPDRMNSWKCALMYSEGQFMWRLSLKMQDGYTLLLHKFEHRDQCLPHPHNHPWNFSARLLKGSYLMGIGTNAESFDRIIRVNAQDQYFFDRRMFHFIYPLSKVTYSAVVRQSGAGITPEGKTASIARVEQRRKSELFQEFRELMCNPAQLEA